MACNLENTSKIRPFSFVFEAFRSFSSQRRPFDWPTSISSLRNCLKVEHRLHLHAFVDLAPPVSNDISVVVAPPTSMPAPIAPSMAPRVLEIPFNCWWMSHFATPLRPCMQPASHTEL